MLTLVSICAIFAIASSFKLERRNGKLWVGVGYIAAKNNVSAAGGVVIGVAGVADSALQGFAWGLAFGGVAGAIAGAAVGL